jgi:hypothetical protein
MARLPYTNDSGIVNADLVEGCDSPPRRGDSSVMSVLHTVKKRQVDAVAHHKPPVDHRAKEAHQEP